VSFRKAAYYVTRKNDLREFNELRVVAPPILA
jgi:hypothetical protein